MAIIKQMKPSSVTEYRELKQRLQRQARDAGRKRSDVAKAVRCVRDRQ